MTGLIPYPATGASNIRTYNDGDFMVIFCRRSNIDFGMFTNVSQKRKSAQVYLRINTDNT